MSQPVLVVIMGVAGSGKSMVGAAVAQALGLPFVEADDFHSEANRQTMAAGKPLTDADRRPWIADLTKALTANSAPATILACSALTPAVRGWLEAGFPGRVGYILLSGTPDLIARRLAERRGHYAGPDLLASQFEALTPPANVDIVDISKDLDDVVEDVRKRAVVLLQH